MTQKLLEGEKSVEKLLQAIDPKGIADESMRRTVEILLNLVEELNSKIKGLESENQQLRDENNRLKGEQLDFGQKSCSRKIYANKQMINLVYSYEQKKSIATNSPTHSNINYKVGLGKYW
jgi:regulator of replication initiation timing